MVIKGKYFFELGVTDRKFYTIKEHVRFVLEYKNIVV